MPNRQVSEGRQATYYLGTVLMVIGFLTFGSTFVSFALHFGDFSNFESRASSEFLTAILGMALIVAGGLVRGIGARGLAGSGVVLDPEQAREDLEPWSRMAGGMVRDGADEAGIDLGQVLRHEDGGELPFDEKLRRLHQLHTEGILTDEEYARQKQKILDEQ